MVRKKHLVVILQILLATAVVLLVLLVYMMSMPGEFLHGPLPVANAQERRLAERLNAHVEALAGDIGERHYQVKAALDAAADYIDREFRAMGFDARREQFGEADILYRNIIAEVPGTTAAGEILIMGAHYDTVWLSPGADDNASGVAVLLELARRWHGRRPARTLRFVAFSNEEEPFFATDLMGSLVHARGSLQRGDNIIGMISLEMLGYYSHTPGSQQYPFPFNYFYPDTAAFIAFVGNLRSRAFLRQSLGHFRAAGRMAATGLAAPAVLVPDIRRSDQYAFWAQGIPAFMITDTANFRNPWYHTGGDLPPVLDYEMMARCTAALDHMLDMLAN